MKTLSPMGARTARLAMVAAAMLLAAGSALADNDNERGNGNGNSANREPTRALNTYSEGNVTTSVRKNSAGTFTVEATSCSTADPPPRSSANDPMHAP